MTATLLCLVLSYGADLDAQGSKTWRVREAARKRLDATPAFYAPAGLLRLKHRDAAVRAAAERAVGAYRRWYCGTGWKADIAADFPHPLPWLDMADGPSRFSVLAEQPHPPILGLPHAGDGYAIVSYYMASQVQGSDDAAPNWGRWRRGTGDYVADLFRAGATRGQVVSMLRAMRLLELEYLRHYGK